MSKYGNRRFERDGYQWDSYAEYARFVDLRTLAEIGEIADLTIKPKYVLLKPFRRDGKHYRGITYIADFRYVENGKEIVEDVKGAKTAVYKMKKQLLLAQYPGINFIEVAA